MKIREHQDATGFLYAGLQIEEDLSFKRKEWVIERSGWVLMTLLLIAALAGLFSNGPLSKTTVTDKTSTLKIGYERFLRLQTASIMNIEILPAGYSNRVALLLGGGFASELEIENIRPEPAATTLTENGWVLEFETSSLPSTIIMKVTPEKPGFITGQIGLAGHDSQPLPIFVYP